MEVRYILIALCFIVGTALGSDEMFQAQAKCIQETKLTGGKFPFFYILLLFTGSGVRCSS